MEGHEGFLIKKDLAATGCNERPEGPYISLIARECAKFYQDPENIKAFREWLREKKSMREKGCRTCSEGGRMEETACH